MGKECLHCGEDNIDSAVKCKNCGAMLEESGIAKESSPAKVLVMIDLKSGKTIKICGDCLIGRKGDVETDFFAEDCFVSEQHCRIILENGEYRIAWLPTTNPTKINNEELTRGIRRVIRNGDFLTIADKKFEITIRDDTAQTEAAHAAIPPANCTQDTKTCYIIICPKCGSEYEVCSLDERINECGNCDDYDKHEISGVGAKVKYAN